ncbi:MAG: hypothetical protein ABI333_08240 [bacterium]
MKHIGKRLWITTVTTAVMLLVVHVIYLGCRARVAGRCGAHFGWNASQGQCIRISCPEGQAFFEQSCVATCPAGYLHWRPNPTVNGGKCLTPAVLRGVVRIYNSALLKSPGNSLLLRLRDSAQEALGGAGDGGGDAGSTGGRPGDSGDSPGGTPPTRPAGGGGGDEGTDL